MEKRLNPVSRQEALQFLNDEHPLIYSGGTDFMIRKKNIRNYGKGRSVLFINKIEGLKNIRVKDNRITIGAGTTISEILGDKHIPEIYRTILSGFASPPIRNLATIGGNICNASPAGDSIPFLYMFDAKIKLVSLHGERILPINEFIMGPGKTQCEDHEMVSDIEFDYTGYDSFFYRKVGQRSANAITKCSFLGAKNADKGMIRELRICFGSVAPVIVRDRNLESRFEEEARGIPKERYPGLLDSLITDYGKLINPIDDVRSSAYYRKNVSLNLLNYFLKEDHS